MTFPHMQKPSMITIFFQPNHYKIPVPVNTISFSHGMRKSNDLPCNTIPSILTLGQRISVDFGQISHSPHLYFVRCFNSGIYHIIHCKSLAGKHLRVPHHCGAYKSIIMKSHVWMNKRSVDWLNLRFCKY